MNYSKLKILPLSSKQIKEVADRVRIELWGDEIPIDIEHILEVKLGIFIVPLIGLQDQISFDSFISSDWKYVYVDNKRYMSDNYYQRIRFSLAHELGHFILHKEIFELLDIGTMEDYYSFYREVPNDQYSFLEAQANKFAGYLLIPREALEQSRMACLVRARKKIIGTSLEGIDDAALMDVVTGELAEIFNVSSLAMEIGLKS